VVILTTFTLIIGTVMRELVSSIVLRLKTSTSVQTKDYSLG